MSKKRVLHAATLVIFGVFIVLGLASTCSSTPSLFPSTNEGVVVISETTSKSVVNAIPVPVNRPFETIGLVFASSTTEFDSKGREMSSQEGIVTMLLREAQKLGGEDILNLRIDENVTHTEYTTNRVVSGEGNTRTVEDKILLKKITYTGSALAIKYLNIDETRYGRIH